MVINIKENSWQKPDFNLGTIVGIIGVIIILIESDGDILSGSIGWLGPILFAIGIFVHREIKTTLLNVEIAKQERIKKNRERAKIVKNKDKAVKKYSVLISEFKKHINSIEIPNSDDFRNSIVANEQIIIEKADKLTLYNLLKINEFLEDYRSNIVIFKDYTISRIENYKDSDESQWKWSERNLFRDNSRGITYEQSMQLDISEIIDSDPVGDLENFINNYHYYFNLALLSVVFLLNDKNLQYMEIYSAFEKLGAFDSSWQKQLSEKLEEFKDSIIDSLDTISNKLSRLDNNFSTLNNNISSLETSLKSIDSSVQTNNFISAINMHYLRKIGKSK